MTCNVKKINRPIKKHLLSAVKHLTYKKDLYYILVLIVVRFFDIVSLYIRSYKVKQIYRNCAVNFYL